MKRAYFLAVNIILLTSLTFFSGCDDDEGSSKLTAETFDAEEVTVNSALLKGSTTGSGIRSRGIVYNTVGMPVLEDDDALPLKPGTGEFSIEAIELSPDTRYHFRAYAFSDAGIVYGEEKTFRTLDEILPVVTISQPENITANSALFKGTVVNIGSYPALLERGFVWSETNQTPTVNDNKHSVAGSVGEMTFDNQSLELNTTYYVRVFARSQAGTAYSEVISFSTLDLNVPEVSMDVVKIIRGIQTNNTTIAENTIQRAGVVYSETINNPRLANSDFVDADNPGVNFSVSITGLKPHTLYYVAAFAIDENGTGYSDVQHVRTGTYGTVDNRLVLITPPSSYLMGWTSDVDGNKDAQLFVNNSEANGNCAANDVSPYWIAKYLVTNQEYCDFLNEFGQSVSQSIVANFNIGQPLFRPTQVEFSEVGGVWTPNAGKENHPARAITWIGAYEFCVFYGGKLPDEAEWEIAARGGKYTDATGKTRFSGSDDADEVAWHSGNSGGSTHPVGQKAPNGHGIYDMSGNVYEWTFTWYARYLATWVQQISVNPSGSFGKPIRGGSFDTGLGNIRSVFRTASDWANDGQPDNLRNISNVGFRFAMETVPEDLNP